MMAFIPNDDELGLTLDVRGFISSRTESLAAQLLPNPNSENPLWDLHDDRPRSKVIFS
jgi:hypothetical protein